MWSHLCLRTKGTYPPLLPVPGTYRCDEALPDHQGQPDAGRCEPRDASAQRERPHSRPAEFSSSIPPKRCTSGDSLFLLVSRPSQGPRRSGMPARLVQRQPRHRCTYEPGNGLHLHTHTHTPASWTAVLDTHATGRRWTRRVAPRRGELRPPSHTNRIAPMSAREESVAGWRSDCSPPNTCQG